MDLGLTGARALGFGDEFGTIEVGKRASLLAVRVPEGVGDVEEYLVSGIEPEAIRWLDALEALITSLQDMPERFPVAREDALFPEGTLRQALHFRHRVLFTIDGETVRVLHVRHGMRRDLDDI